jgi:hypothetical protein
MAIPDMTTADVKTGSAHKLWRRRARPQLRPDEKMRAVILGAARTEFAITKG